jgi:hypothetical protein
MTDRERLSEATKVINKMQNIISPYSFGSGFFGQTMSEAYNLGAKFNADNPDLFNEYLESRKTGSEPVGEKK